MEINPGITIPVTADELAAAGIKHAGRAVESLRINIRRERCEHTGVMAVGYYIEALRDGRAVEITGGVCDDLADATRNLRAIERLAHALMSDLGEIMESWGVALDDN